MTLADEQLDFYDLDGVSFKSLLISQAGFEAGGQGLNGQYEVYTITLPTTFFAALADGSTTVDLGLKGPVFSPPDRYGSLFQRAFSGLALNPNRLRLVAGASIKTDDGQSAAHSVTHPMILH